MRAAQFDFGLIPFNFNLQGNRILVFLPEKFAMGGSSYTIWLLPVDPALEGSLLSYSCLHVEGFRPSTRLASLHALANQLQGRMGSFHGGRIGRKELTLTWIRWPSASTQGAVLPSCAGLA